METVEHFKYMLPAQLLTSVSHHFRFFAGFKVGERVYKGMLSALPDCVDAFLFS
jgi:hypothetical protein